MDLAGATLTRANLSYACLVDANLTGAVLTNTTNLSHATFCRTTMPNGTLNNSGCDNPTACCPTCLPATCQSLGKSCGSWPDGCGGTRFCGDCGAGSTPSCDNGTCTTCVRTCAAACEQCVNRVDGSTACRDFGNVDCGAACTKDADCPASHPLCITALTRRSTNATETMAAMCGIPAACGLFPSC